MDALWEVISCVFMIFDIELSLETLSPNMSAVDPNVIRGAGAMTLSCEVVKCTTCKQRSLCRKK